MKYMQTHSCSYKKIYGMKYAIKNDVSFTNEGYMTTRAKLMCSDIIFEDEIFL